MGLLMQTHHTALSGKCYSKQAAVTRCFISFRFSSLGSGSDYTMFQHNLGIACIDARYTYDTVSQPLLHF